MTPAVKTGPNTRAGMGRWLLILAVGLLATHWLHSALGLGGAALDDLFSRWIYDVIELAAGIACVAQARGQRAWTVLGVGLLASSIGGFIYSTAANLETWPVPSISDVFWLAIYPCAYVALLMMLRARGALKLRATRLDGMISGITAASVMACITLPTAIANSAGAPFWTQATNLAYPVADLILFGAIVSAVALTGWRLDRTLAVLAISIIAWEAADVIYLFNPSDQLGNIADSLVLTGAVGMAAAAALYRRPLAPQPDADSGLFAPVGFGVVALGVLVVGILADITPVGLGLAAVALALALVRMALALAENRALLSDSRVQALTDPLTGLANRRQLKLDLAHVQPGTAYALALFDLNGFKGYNDSFGHGAGDTLLAQLGASLADAVRGQGTAYRMGGDEFCVLATGANDERERMAERWSRALGTRGDGFSIDAAYGVATVPLEAAHAADALALADARMYGNKAMRGRPAPARQLASVLTAVLEEHAPSVAAQGRTVSELAMSVATRIGLDEPDTEALRYAATFHDLGKMAIPATILEKPGPLSPTEWSLIHQHPVIGERILAAAPALERSARLVRWSHERMDGRGYPDRLSGEQIPLAARIIHAADAFVAMSSERAYRPVRPQDQALSEMRRCAGTQFDMNVVRVLEDVVRSEAAVPEALVTG